ncbi:Na+/H+ antiporter subunit D [Thermosipho ferrireducens]|uniref:Na+/H+ antiporter subunit D n=1 Tax=Thermosipho ferrireducens TaxID=2571116 RepID=A0ABX7S7Q2_9BACT|nr:proton-conducting transporter membrane subunit [Thermosipho ferrireducens]QTA38614.1 Na+/H+ antiporter subunit D [Thermosipho ferrireducens]
MLINLISLSISFIFYILKKVKYLPLLITIFSISGLFFKFDGYLIGYGGIHIVNDNVSFYFILTNVMVTFIVSLMLLKNYEASNYHKNFFISLTHVVLNFLFVSYDLFNIYVLLETITLLIVLLILSGQKFVHKLIGLKYIFVSTFAMNLYLIGVGISYYKGGTFDIEMVVLTGVAKYLIQGALFIKSGLFLFGLWLPDVYSETESEISALLAGIYSYASIYALVRLSDSADVRLIGVLTFVFGVIMALIVNDYKKVLAYSSVSQVGLMLFFLEYTPFFVFVHAIAKSTLFLSSKYVPKNPGKSEKVELLVFIPILISGLSISGMPLTLGGGVKEMLFKNLPMWSLIVSFLTSLYIGKILPVNLKVSDKVDFQKMVLFFSGIIPLFLGVFYYSSFGNVWTIVLGLFLGEILFSRVNFHISFSTEMVLTLSVFSVGFFGLLQYFLKG